MTFSCNMTRGLCPTHRGYHYDISVKSHIFPAVLSCQTATVVSSAVVWRQHARAGQHPIVNYKDPGCDCAAWIKHMKANGFTATVTNTTDVNAIKRRARLRRSCGAVTRHRRGRDRGHV
jgi:hypothetical protein